MGLERRVQTIPATGRIEVGRGNYLLYLTGTGAVEIRMERDGTSDRFIGVVGGLLIRRIAPYDTITIIGTPGVSTEVIVGSEVVDRDETDIRLAVTAIAGTISTTEAPASSWTTTVPNTTLAAVATVDIAANLARKRLWIQNDLNSATHFWVRDQSVTTSGGVQLAPGQSVVISNTGAIRIRNNDAALTAQYSIQEEA